MSLNAARARGLLVAVVGAALVVACTAGPAAAPATTGLPVSEPTAVTSSTPELPSISPSPAPTPAPTPSPALTPAFGLSSPAFADGASIPRRFTCDGENVSPPLAWTGLPVGTQSLALIVDDPDAAGFVHWVAYNITPGPGALGERASSGTSAPPQGRNSFGTKGYGGPCPPSGTHHYRFRLLALDALLSPSGMPRASDVLAATAGHVLGETRLTGSYRRS